MQKISNEKVIIKYDAMKDYKLYSKGRLVGHIPAVISPLEQLVINYSYDQVRLLYRGFILAYWRDIDLILINELLED